MTDILFYQIFLISFEMKDKNAEEQFPVIPVKSNFMAKELL